LHVGHLAYHGTNDESECLRTLRNSLPYEQFKARNPDRVDGTCKWFLDHANFKIWRDSVKSSILWVSADPGCGKSVLSKSLLDRELLSSTSRRSCYFFFKDDNIQQKSSTNALCTLLHQLFSTKPTLLKYAIPDFKSNGGELSRSLSELWNILVDAAADPEAGEIVCILDALDECEEREQTDLIKALTNFYRSPDNHQNRVLKFLVTSRPYFSIERHFKELTSSLPTIRLAGEMETRLIELEINLVIKAQVNRIGFELDLEDPVKSLLERKLSEVRHRTYLWLHLILRRFDQDLLPGLTRTEMEEIIRATPPTVFDAYEAILRKVPEQYKQQATKALHIIVAAARPLTLQELNVALAIKEGTTSCRDHDLIPKEVFPVRIRNLCGLFIRINNSKVTLIHQTAKEFLVTEDTATLRRPLVLKDISNSPGHSSSCQGVWKHSLEPRESNLLLAKICIW
jgi:hypothetical protein